MLILALGLCLATGYLLTATAWPFQKPALSDLLMKLSLSVGFGLGVFSAVFFLGRVLGATHLVVIDASVLAILLALYALCRRFANIAEPSPCPHFSAPTWVRRILTGSFVLAVLAAFSYSLLRIMAHPHGDGWDAFSIWNLHARFLFLGGYHWRDGFSGVIPWSHPDYPLLLPAAIAHFWSYLGSDTQAVPAIIGFVFTFSTLALLVSSLALLRGRIAATLGGLALACTPFFVEQGTSQYVDVPLSFFILATIVLLGLGLQLDRARYGLFVLSGLAAGFAAWTKNEGLLFLSAVVIAQFWALNLRESQGGERPPQDWKSVSAFLLGAAPMLVVIAWFRHSIAPPGDLFSSPGTMIHKILTPSRYWIVLQWFAKEFFRFGNWWIVPGTVAMIAFLLLTPRKRNISRDPLLHTSTLALTLTLGGYFAIYLITPRDLYWHLRFSLNRLFLQLWPSTVFLFFLFVSRQTSSASQIELGFASKQGPTC